MLRRSFLARSLAAAVATTTAAAAERPTGTRRLAVLLYDNAELWQSFESELRTELAAFGWREGKNLVLDWRYANGDDARLRALADALVASRPDAIVTRGTPATRALQRATTSIPILTGVGDPIGSGFARSFAAPGGNITGVSWADVETSAKQIEVLRALVPALATLRMVVPADRAPFVADLTRPLEAASRAVGVATETAYAGNVAELDSAFRVGSLRGKIAAFVFGIAQIDPKAITASALAAGMPTIFINREFVEVGGLASYSLYWDNQTQRAAAQIDKVLRGEKAARIPFELPTRSVLAINTTTARALGLTIPQSLLLRADVIVE